MNVMDVLIPFLGGLGMFIYGMQIMAKGLENAAGDRMKSLLEILTKNKVMAVLLGAGITAVIQSSSATTVMVVGFVNAGIMDLQQAIGVIMGANIGTTVTGWIVSSVEWAKFLSPAMLAPVAIFIGVIIMLLGKRYAVKETANIVIGFGLLFVGITAMSAAVMPLRESETFRNIFVTLGRNPLLGVAAGTVVTAVIQSSSASVGILQSLAATGLVPFSTAIYIIMGQNIGTCATSLLSSIGAKKNAKTASLMHLLFNLIGTLIFGVAAVLYFQIAEPAWMNGSISQTQISLVHTLFNVGTTLLLFPASNLLIRLAKRINRVQDEKSDEGKVRLDERMLETPGLALETLSDETVRMGGIVMDNLRTASEVLFTLKRSQISEIKDREQVVDRLTAGISDYAMSLSSLQISEREHRDIGQLLQVVADMERISDQCENISELAENLLDKKASITDEAKNQLSEMMEVCIASYAYALRAFGEEDAESARLAVEKEMESDRLEVQFRAGNIERITKHRCSTQAGIVFQDALVSLERISDHARNIAEEKKLEAS